MKRLEGLKWKPRWTSRLGCLEGCLEFLGVEVTPAWLFGATGHAFVINVHEAVCPSGPTAWNSERCIELARNLGCDIESLFSHKRRPDFEQKQKQAWEQVRRAIDEGLPCCGWELEIPEYYVIRGYDDVGYYYSGPRADEGGGPKPWAELGDSEIGVLELQVVRPGVPADHRASVKQALAFALEHAGGPRQWIFPGYASGLAGFDAWSRSVEADTADGVGMAYNAAVWSECRRFGAEFLVEARRRLGPSAPSGLERAAASYREVADNLEQLAELFPFFGMQPAHMADGARRQRAVKALGAARQAEQAGLAVLEDIVAVL